MSRAARKPTIRQVPPSRRDLGGFNSRRENIYLAGDADSAALISISRMPDGRLLIDVYRADADVVVRAPLGNTAPALGQQ